MSLWWWAHLWWPGRPMIGYTVANGDVMNQTGAQHFSLKAQTCGSLSLWWICRLFGRWCELGRPTQDPYINTLRASLLFLLLFLLFFFINQVTSTFYDQSTEDQDTVILNTSIIFCTWFLKYLLLTKKPSNMVFLLLVLIVLHLVVRATIKLFENGVGLFLSLVLTLLVLQPFERSTVNEDLPQAGHGCITNEAEFNASETKISVTDANRLLQMERRRDDRISIVEKGRRRQP